MDIISPTSTTFDVSRSTPPSSAPSPCSSPNLGQDDPFRIAIVGGGIGGLTAAIFLNKFCVSPSHRRIEISIYEQASELREIGAGIALGPNAMKLYAQIQTEDGEPLLLDKINSITGDRDGVWYQFRRFDTGGHIVTVPQSQPEDSKVKYGAVSRAELLEILLNFVRAQKEVGGRLYTDKSLKSVSEVKGDDLTRDFETKGNRPVKLTFADGTFATADFVIAADGIRSAVRHQFINDEAVYGGKVLYRGQIPVDELPKPWPFETHAVMWNGIGKHFAVYTISANKTLNIIACTDKKASEIPDLQESWVTSCHKSDLEEDFKGFNDPIVQEIIRLMPDYSSKWRINDRKPLKEWAFMDGRVVLLGDAAHPMVPHQSAGAGQAVEDAYILSKALGEYLSTSPPPAPGVTQDAAGDKKQVVNGSPHHDLKTWTNLYQRVRLPRAAKTQESSRKAGDLFEMMSPEMAGLTYDGRLSILAERAMVNMRRIWAEDIDDVYKKIRAEII